MNKICEMDKDTLMLYQWFDNVARTCNAVIQITDFNDKIGFGNYKSFLIAGLESVANRLGLTIHYLPFDCDDTHCTEVRVFYNGVQFYDLVNRRN